MLLGGAGLSLGLALGAGLHRWKAVVALGAGGIAAAVFALGADADAGALVVLTNLAGWAFGLTTGTGVAKLVRHRS